MKFLTFVLLVFFILGKTTFAVSLNYSNYEDALVALKMMNKPALLTIESSDGDLIDCVDKRKQPAFDHPLLKNHKIQRVPKEWLKTKKEESKSSSNKATQTWLKNGTRCPKGTIPIRRVTVNDVMRRHSIRKFGKKQNSFFHQLRTQNNMYAMATHSSATEMINGAQATMDLWNPYVEDDEESAAKISFLSGPVGGLNIIESGWHVYPNYYGDKMTRFFIYWTNDSDRTGCYNIDSTRTGFIQNSETEVLGASYSETSIPGGKQFAIDIKIRRNPTNGNWWLTYDGSPVGYWPSVLFDHLKRPARHVTWGGQVVNTKAAEKPSSTEMGSGEFANKGLKKASYFYDLRVAIEDGNLDPVPLDKLSPRVTNEQCYSMSTSLTQTPPRRNILFYGGPGLSSETCH